MYLSSEGRSRTLAQHCLERVSSVAVIPHLVGTSFLFPSFPRRPEDSILEMWDSPIPEEVSSPMASLARRSVSFATESTFLLMLAWLTTSALTNPPDGPRGVLIVSKDGGPPIDTGRTKSSSTSTAPDDMAIIWVASRTRLDSPVVFVAILLPPVTKLACLAATSSRG